MTAAEEAKAEEVRSRMSAFLDSTDLDTMFLRTFAVGSGAPGAARHDGTVKEESPDVELRSLPSDGMTATARFQTSWQKFQQIALMSNCGLCQATALTPTARSETLWQKLQRIRNRRRTAR